MLKIQVLGNGLVPRMGRLAPIKDPFPADRTLIGTILSISKMKINYLDPKTNKLHPLTRENFNDIWNELGDAEYGNVSVTEAPIKEEKKELPKETKSEPVIEKVNVETKSNEKSEDELLEEMIKEEEKNKSDKNKKKH